MMYKTIVFDIDGTLLDSEQVLLSSLKKALYDVLGITCKEHELQHLNGVNEDEVAAMFTSDVKAQDDIKNLWTSYVRDNPLPPLLFPEVQSTLETLRTRGTMLGIVTSKTREHMKYDFDKIGMHSLFSFIITSDDVIHTKPHAEPLLLALKKSGCQRETMLYIGDTYADFLCAKQAQVPFALASWGAKDDQRLATSPIIVEKFHDIITL